MRLSKLVTRIKTARRLPVVMALVVMTSCAVIGAGNLVRTEAVAVNGSNDIISDGASSPSDMIAKVKLDNSTGKYGGDLATIYAYKYYNLPASEYSRFVSNAKKGTIYQDGHVVVDGRTVATNAITLSRNTTNPTNHTPITIGGKVYSEVSVQYTMKSTQLDTMVLFDAQGNTQTVIINKCGNPLRITPNNPVHACNMLNVSEPINRTTYNFSTNVTAQNGSTLNKVVYDFGDGSAPVESTDAAKSISHTYAKAGTYSARVTVYVNVPGSQVYAITPAGNCVKTVTVTPEKKPHVSITKTAGPEHKETLVVDRGDSFNYTIIAKNDGEVDLKDVVISDTAPSGIEFLGAKTGSTTISVTGNKLSYTVPSMAVGQSIEIVITAKATTASATQVVNTVCIETPTILGTNPDDCDTASTTTPEPNKVPVCDAATHAIKQVDPAEKDTYLPADSDACVEMEVCVKNSGDTTLVKIYKDTFDATKHSTNTLDCKKPETPKNTPVVIASTGPEALLGGMTSAGALTYGAYTYIASRRAVRRIR